MKTIQPNGNPMNYIPVGANRIRQNNIRHNNIRTNPNPHQMNSPKSNSTQSNSTQKYFPNKNRANAIRPYPIHPFQFARFTFPFTIKKMNLPHKYFPIEYQYCGYETGRMRFAPTTHIHTKFSIALLR